jgi:diguanylate cyclase (GGDEF)-like protein/PAS domain S-box-containing protein
MPNTSAPKQHNLEFLLENINGISFEYDLIGDRFTYVSTHTRRLLGYPPQQWTDLNSWAAMIHPDDRKETMAYCVNETQKEKDHVMQYRMIKADGDVVWVMDIVTLNRDEQGRPQSLFGLILDNTRLKTTQIRLEQEHSFLQSVIDNIRDPIIVINTDYVVELSNKASKEHHSNTFIKDPDAPKCYEISHYRDSPCDGSDHPCPLKAVMKSHQSEVVVHNHPDHHGKDRYFELVCSPIFDKNNNFIGIIESSRDISLHIETTQKLQEQRELLTHQAHYDSLTQLPNRTLFHDRLQMSIEKCKRHSSKLALFFIDLDHFKQINDTLGHAYGDEALKEAAKRLTSVLRAQDTLARLGGDEFTIIIDELHLAQDSSKLAQKLLDQFSMPFRLNTHDFYLSCSIGISIYPDDDTSASNLLKYADNAMYKAKDEGRNNFQFYSREMTEKAFERIVLETSLRQAIKNEEFVLYYQPLFNGQSQKIVGLEALIRWQHYSLGIVSPAKFIPLAEETGLIIDIDNWVMRTAMRQIKLWYDEGLRPGKLSLNLAIKNLESPEFVSQLTSTLSEEHFDAQWLKLEVLERDVMRKPEENILKLQQIHNLGVALAIDDFGTGQSSLTYLKRFPIDQLKIDQSFVREIPHDEEDKAIVQAVIALAKALNLDTVAEGVEKQKQLEFLLENGCENIQGYYFSPPLPRDAMHELLAKTSS